jgi:hypothetical protein
MLCVNFRCAQKAFVVGIFSMSSVLQTLGEQNLTMCLYRRIVNSRRHVSTTLSEKEMTSIEPKSTARTATKRTKKSKPATFADTLADVAKMWPEGEGKEKALRGFSQLLGLVSSVDEALQVLDLCIQHRRYSKAEAATKYVEMMAPHSRSAKSFGEIKHLLDATESMKRLELEEISAFRSHLLRRLIPLSDNQKQAEAVLDCCPSGSPEEKRAMERVLRFCGTSFHGLRRLFAHSVPGSNRETMILRVYLAELKKGKTEKIAGAQG